MPSQGVTNVANAIINKINNLISSHNSNENAHQDIRASIPSAEDNYAPKEDGAGSSGSASTWSRSDHTHPKSSIYAEASHTHNTTEIRDSSAHDRIGSDVNDDQTTINDSIDYALTNLDDNILHTKIDLVGFDKFQVKNFINPNNWENSGCTYSNGVLTFSGSNSFTATFPTDSLVGELADFELSFDYIIDDGLILNDTIDFEVFGRKGHYVVTEEDINNGYVIINISFKSENNIGTITSEASGDQWNIDYVGSLNPYTINAITPVGNSTKIANIRYKANDIISLNDNLDLKANSADLSTVATTGDYEDLLNLPEEICITDFYYDATSDELVLNTCTDNDISTITSKEDKSNKVISWSATPTHSHYPSEKLVKDYIDDMIGDIIEYIEG